MTKNTVGGNKSKKFARKHNATQHDHALLLSSHTLEKYAIVTKMLGNGMFYANTYDHHNDIIGHIRNKFKGRSKHSNLLYVGAFILLGFREWETPHFKHADLIHIYNNNDILLIQNFVDLSPLSIYQHQNTLHTQHDFHFSDNNNDDTTLHIQHTDIQHIDVNDIDIDIHINIDDI